MTPQLGVSLAIIILMALKLSFMLLNVSIMLLRNIFSTGIFRIDVTFEMRTAFQKSCLFNDKLKVIVRDSISKQKAGEKSKEVERQRERERERVCVCV